MVEVEAEEAETIRIQEETKESEVWAVWFYMKLKFWIYHLSI